MKFRCNFKRKLMDQAAGNKNKIKSKTLSVKKSAGTSKDKPTAKKPSGVPSSKVMDSIINALSHGEAEDGLYFRNFFLLHEEDQRPGVKAATKDIVAAMNQLLEEGKVRIDYDDLEVTFKLV